MNPYVKDLNEIINSLELHMGYPYTIFKNFITKHNTSYIPDDYDYNNLFKTFNFILDEKKIISLGNVKGFFIVDKSIIERDQVIIKLYVDDNLVGRVIGKGGVNLKLILSEMKETLNTDKEIILKVYSNDKKDSKDIESFIKNIPNSKHRILYKTNTDIVELKKEDDELIGFDSFGNLVILYLYDNENSTFSIDYNRIIKVYEMKEVYNRLE